MPERDNSVQSAVYQELKRGILALQLAPGSAMSTQDIANRLGVSRTPVREAFIRLQREGLVDALPQRGTLVSRIDLRRVEEERFIRESLELSVIPIFMRCYKPEDMARLRTMVQQQKQLYESQRPVELLESDSEFHHVFFEASGQRLAWETLSSVNGHYNRIRMLTMQTEVIPAGVVQQHEQLLNLIEAGDPAAVCVELANHVEKINYEKTDLVQQYPDYFSTGEVGMLKKL